MRSAWFRIFILVEKKMIEVFGLPKGTIAKELYMKYEACMGEIKRCETLTAQLRDSFLHVLNEAYDEALSETKEANEASMSPKPAE